VQRYDGVLTLVLAAGQAYIANYAYHPATWHKGVITGLPNVVQLPKKRFVIRDISHLIRVVSIIL
jgi:hypothetical protein